MNIHVSIYVNINLNKCQLSMYYSKTDEEKQKIYLNISTKFNFSNYSYKSKYFDDSNKLVIGEMKDKTGLVANEEFVELKPNSFLVDNSKHKKAKNVSKNVVAAISHNEYKDVLLNNKCIRHSMNRIQSKDHRIGTYEINKISLSCFDDRIYIQNNGYDGLAIEY